MIKRDSQKGEKIMGQRKLIIGTIAGALLGALAMQFDKETRAYTKESISKLKDSTNDLISNPAESVHKLRTSFDKLNQTISTGAESAINALDQVETSLDRITNKN